MQEIIQVFQNNIGNKLTVELANGMITFIEKKLKDTEQQAVEIAQPSEEE